MTSNTWNDSCHTATLTHAVSLILQAGVYLQESLRASQAHLSLLQALPLYLGLPQFLSSKCLISLHQPADPQGPHDSYKEKQNKLPHWSLSRYPETGRKEGERERREERREPIGESRKKMGKAFRKREEEQGESAGREDKEGELREQEKGIRKNKVLWERC